VPNEIRLSVPRVSLSSAATDSIRRLSEVLAKVPTRVAGAMTGFTRRLAPDVANLSLSQAGLGAAATVAGGPVAAIGLTVVGVGVGGLQRAAAQGDRGALRLVEATSRLVDAVFHTALGSQVVSLAVGALADGIGRAARAVESFFASGGLDRAIGAIGRAVDLFGSLVALVQDVAVVTMGRLELAALEAIELTTQALAIRAPGSPTEDAVAREKLVAAAGVVPLPFIGPAVRGGLALAERQVGSLAEALRAIPQRKADLATAIFGAQGRLFGVLDRIAARVGLGEAGRPRVLTLRERSLDDLAEDPGDVSILGRDESDELEEALDDKNLLNETVATSAAAGLDAIRERIAAWSTSPAARGIAETMRAVASDLGASVSTQLERFGSIVTQLRATLLQNVEALQPILAATEGFSGALGMVAKNVEAIASTNARVERVLTRARLGILAATAVALAGVEVAAGIASFPNVPVMAIHFTAAALYAVAAGFAAGNALASRVPTVDEVLAGERAAASSGGGMRGGPRSGTLTLIVEGTVNTRDQRWIRENVLLPIASGGATVPEAAEFAGIRIRGRGLSGSQIIRDFLRQYGQTAGEAWENAYEAVVDHLLGPWLRRDVRRLRRRLEREVKRLRRRLRRVF